MNIIFFNFVDRLIQLCCLKSNNSNTPEECKKAEENDLHVLSVEENESEN